MKNEAAFFYIFPASIFSTPSGGMSRRLGGR